MLVSIHKSKLPVLKVQSWLMTTLMFQGQKKKKKNVHRRLETMSELQVNYKEGKQDSFSTI